MDNLITQELQSDLLTDFNYAEFPYPGREDIKLNLVEQQIIEEANFMKHRRLDTIAETRIISEVEPPEKIDPQQDVSDNISEQSSVRSLPIFRAEETTQDIITPNLNSKQSANQIIQELIAENRSIRQQYMKTTRVNTFLDLLKNNSQMMIKKKFIQDYARDHHHMILTPEDIGSISNDEIGEIYQQIRQIQTSERYGLVYKVAFDLVVDVSESFINKYLFKLHGLSQNIVYEDISLEIEDCFKGVIHRTVGRYCTPDNSIFKILFYLITKVLQTRFSIT